MVESSPFTILAVAPTLDRNAVKRAYFAQLASHPPHSDPEGFRKVRDAYETLNRPGALELAYAEAPLDRLTLLEAARARFDLAIERECAAAQLKHSTETARQRFVETVSKMTYLEALRVFGNTQQ